MSQTSYPSGFNLSRHNGPCFWELLPLSMLLPQWWHWTPWEAGLFEAGLSCGCFRNIFYSAHKKRKSWLSPWCFLFFSFLFFPLKSEFNVLGLWHFGKCFLHAQGCQSGCGIVSPALGHEFPHLPQTLQGGKWKSGSGIRDMYLLCTRLALGIWLLILNFLSLNIFSKAPFKTM